MRTRLIITFLLFACMFKAQNGPKISKKIKKMNPLSFDLYYGNKVFTKNFYSQLNSANKIDFNLPIQQLGIGFTNYDRLSTLWYDNSIQMAFYYYLPNTIVINDTIKSIISGFAYSFGLGPSFFRKSKYFRLNTSLGFNTGRTTLTQIEDKTLKNSFFAPKILFQPKIIIKRFCFSLLLDYSYDISNKSWKQLNNAKDSYGLNQFDQSGYSFVVSIGYCPL